MSTNWELVLHEAHRAGKQAAQAVTPTPMVVQQHASPLDDNSPVVKQWVVPQGPCGFAWVNIPGNSALGRWVRKNRWGGRGGWRKGYPKGYTLWVADYGQSVELKAAYAGAFANVLRDNGVNAYSQSRLD